MTNLLDTVIVSYITHFPSKCSIYAGCHREGTTIKPNTNLWDGLTRERQNHSHWATSQVDCSMQLLQVILSCYQSEGVLVYNRLTFESSSCQEFPISCQRMPSKMGV